MNTFFERASLVKNFSFDFLPHLMSDGLEEQISFGSNFFLSFFLFEFKDLHVNYTFVEGRWNLTECRVSVEHSSITILFKSNF